MKYRNDSVRAHNGPSFQLEYQCYFRIVLLSDTLHRTRWYRIEMAVRALNWYPIERIILHPSKCVYTILNKTRLLIRCYYYPNQNTWNEHLHIIPTKIWACLDQTLRFINNRKNLLCLYLIYHNERYKMSIYTNNQTNKEKMLKL